MDWRDTFVAFRYLERQMLPFPGGWAQQHAALIEAFEIVAAEHRAITHERNLNAQQEENARGSDGI